MLRCLSGFIVGICWIAHVVAQCPSGQILDCNGVCWDNTTLSLVQDWHCHWGIWLGIWDALCCKDDFCGINGWRSQVEDVVFRAGQTYYLIIDGYGTTDVGNFNLCFENDYPADLCNDESLTVADLVLLLRGFGIQFQVEHLMEFVSVFGGVCD